MMPVRRALRLVIDRKAEIVEADGSVVRSERMALPRPAVIRLVKFVHVPRRFRRQVTNTFLFARDNYRCILWPPPPRAALPGISPKTTWCAVRGGSNN
jgi:5-methylcytosine-specific restriction endonuclease McrA